MLYLAEYFFLFFIPYSTSFSLVTLCSFLNPYCLSLHNYFYVCFIHILTTNFHYLIHIFSTISDYGRMFSPDSTILKTHNIKFLTLSHLSPLRSSRHMDALFAKAKLYENRLNYKEAMDTLNLLVVAYPGFTGPLVEKAKVNLSEQDWDQCLESANRLELVKRSDENSDSKKHNEQLVCFPSILCHVEYKVTMISPII